MYSNLSTKRFGHEFKFDGMERVLDNKDVYEFGVYSGNSLTRLLNIYLEHNKKIRHVFAIDSFEGLPEEEKFINKHYDWQVGNFDARKIFKHPPDKVLQRYFSRKYKPIPVDVIKSWYSELNKETVKKYDMGIASYIHIDCDLYISAKQALKFIFSNGLAEKGTIIAYNDIWWETPWTVGEGRAHKEIAKEHSVNFYELCRNTYIVQ